MNLWGQTSTGIQLSMDPNTSILSQSLCQGKCRVGRLGGGKVLVGSCLPPSCPFVVSLRVGFTRCSPRTHIYSSRF
jgi:hypothetical protein